jgi:RNA polymerase sigma-B factor
LTRRLLLLRQQSVDEQERARLLDEVVLINLWFAGEVAARFSGRGVPLDDLRQIAVVGLLKAVGAFRPDENGSFLAFALSTVSGELKRYFRDTVWLVRVPRRLHEELSPGELDERMWGCRHGVPLDEVDGSVWPDDFGAAVERLETADLLRSVLAELDPRSQTILVLRYVEEHSQADIGRVVGLSQVQVSREIRRALALAREKSAALLEN